MTTTLHLGLFEVPIYHIDDQMNKAEFDKFADEYHNLHSQNMRSSGENSEFFAEYKIIDVKQLVDQLGMGSELRILDFGAGIGNSVPFWAKHLPSDRHSVLNTTL